MRATVLLAFVLVPLVGCGPDPFDEPNGGGGGGPGPGPGEKEVVCELACAHLYDTCGGTLVTEEGEDVERGDCEPECMEGLLGGNEACLAGTDCQRHSWEACLAYPSSEVEIVGDHDCDLDEEWPEFWERFELEVLVLVNEHRGAGAICGTQQMSPVGPLEMEETLWCAARRYSRKMATEQFFDHVCPDGTSPFDRIQAEGYHGNAMGENIAHRQYTPEQVVTGWMNSPGHCENIMRGQFRHIGIGYDDSNPGFPRLWTQKFGG